MFRLSLRNVGNIYLHFATIFRKEDKDNLGGMSNGMENRILFCNILREKSLKIKSIF